MDSGGAEKSCRQARQRSAFSLRPARSRFLPLQSLTILAQVHRYAFVLINASIVPCTQLSRGSPWLGARSEHSSDLITDKHTRDFALPFTQMQVELSNYEKYLKYRRPEGFEFQYSGDKTYVPGARKSTKTCRSSGSLSAAPPIYTVSCLELWF